MASLPSESTLPESWELPALRSISISILISSTDQHQHQSQTH